MIVSAITSRVRTLLITLGMLVLTLLTLGGYARYQANKRREVEHEIKRLQAEKQYNDALLQRHRDADKMQQEQQAQAQKGKDGRNFFDNY